MHVGGLGEGSAGQVLAPDLEQHCEEQFRPNAIGPQKHSLGGCVVAAATAKAAIRAASSRLTILPGLLRNIIFR